uniref:Uncharacterized protein n=1 Tax=Bacillus cereus TaxID=1396 RepID=A1BZL4_BACCE|nr:hypothetical protein pPER272_AH820_0189 [Bacillus cereus]ABK01064.1 hypothetical protein pPER272_0189 [Bacillus cereus]
MPECIFYSLLLVGIFFNLGVSDQIILCAMNTTKEK